VSALFQRLSDQGRLYARLDVATITTAFIGLIDALSFDFMLDPDSFDPASACETTMKFLHGLIEEEPSSRAGR
jgi:hypothetical protein